MNRIKEEKKERKEKRIVDKKSKRKGE